MRSGGREEMSRSRRLIQPLILVHVCDLLPSPLIRALLEIWILKICDMFPENCPFKNEKVERMVQCLKLWKADLPQSETTACHF